MSPSTPPGAADLNALRDRVVALIRERGWERRDEPFRLSSGAWSHDYVDLRRALSAGPALALAAQAVAALAASEGAAFDVVGGMTMGADPLAHALAVGTGVSWFSVRKAAKDHGRGRRVEGAELGPGVRALVVEDVTTTGASLAEAASVVAATGASVTLVTAVLDRGPATAERLGVAGLRYTPLCTAADLGIEPVLVDEAGPEG